MKSSAGRLRSSSFDRGRKQPRRKILVGICARDKKTHSKPMTQILQRFDKNIFELVIFGDDTILNQPIEKWPIVDCLMSWYSAGFPLEKGIAYVKLRDPFCINNLSSEHMLRDRRKFYSMLERAGIPTPHHVVVNRNGPPESHTKVVESEDSIEVDGVRINKPFVEKPVDAEDHNIYIYYPRRLGGGSKRLFRKVGNVSSKFYPDDPNGPVPWTRIRQEGSYIYEEFIMTQGTDIKIYTVGPDYAHAEARKSPVVDGIVQRDEEGKEVRFPIMLTNKEKDMVRRVCLAFRQNICGFDLLRTPGKSYVCDVNGWSFVKKSHKYYDDAAQLLMLMMLRAVSPERLHTNVLLTTSPPAGLRMDSSRMNRPMIAAPSGSAEPLKSSPSSDSLAAQLLQATTPGHGSSSGAFTPSGAGGTTPGFLAAGSPTPGGGNGSAAGESEGNDGVEELRCVAAIIRHGDRTPKQKMKMLVTHPDFVAMHKKYAKNSKEEAKLKSASQLQHVLEVTRQLIAARITSMQSTASGQSTSLPGQNASRILTPAQGASTTSIHSAAADQASVTSAPVGGEETDHDHEDLDKLLQMKAVLEKGGHFSGINRKVQLKPTRWKRIQRDRNPLSNTLVSPPSSLFPPSPATSTGASQRISSLAPVSTTMVISAAHASTASSNVEAASPSPMTPDGAQSSVDAALSAQAAEPTAGLELDVSGLGSQAVPPASAAGHNSDSGSSKSDSDGQDEVTECLLVLKWGGVLTHAGVMQAEALGQRFRSIMYPGESVGLLRLHSTYRHDLKIYSSDEGRVQMTAAAFVKGFLDLEGELTPILASLVKTVNTSNLLDDSDPARDVMMSLKKRLKRALTSSIGSLSGNGAGGYPDSESDRGSTTLSAGGDKIARPVRPAARGGTLTAARARGSPPYTHMGPYSVHGPLDSGVEADTEGGGPFTPQLGPLDAHGVPSPDLRPITGGHAASVLGYDSLDVSLEHGEGEGGYDQGGRGRLERAGSDEQPGGLDSGAAKIPHMSNVDLPCTAELLAIERELSHPLVQAIAPTRTAALLRALRVIGPNPLSTLHAIYDLITDLTKQLAQLQSKYSGKRISSASVAALSAVITSTHAGGDTAGASARFSAGVGDDKDKGGDKLTLDTAATGPDALLCGGESLWLMLERWRKLRDDFYSVKKGGKFDLSKIPDIYDCIKYDAVHNAALGLQGVQELYGLVKAFADLIVSQEYGIDVDEKADIAARIAHHLLRKVFFDMTAVTVEDTLEIQAAQASRARAQALAQGQANKKEEKAEKAVKDGSGSGKAGGGGAGDGSKAGKEATAPTTAPRQDQDAAGTSHTHKSVAPTSQPRSEAAKPQQASAVGAPVPAKASAAAHATAAASLHNTHSPRSPPLSSRGTATGALVRMGAGARDIPSHVPVPLGTSVSSSKALESSPVVGLVVSIRQHPAYAYTRRVRRKSAPSLLLPGMHKHPSVVEGHTGGFGPLGVAPADDQFRQRQSAAAHAMMARSGVHVLSAGGGSSGTMIAGAQSSSIGQTVNTSEKSQSNRLRPSRAGASASSTGTLAGPASLLDDSIDAMSVTSGGQGSTSTGTSGGIFGLASPGGTVRDTVPKGTVLVPGIRLRQRAAAQAAAASGTVQDTIAEAQEGAVTPGSVNEGLSMSARCEPAAALAESRYSPVAVGSAGSAAADKGTPEYGASQVQAQGREPSTATTDAPLQKTSPVVSFAPAPSPASVSRKSSAAAAVPSTLQLASADQTSSSTPTTGAGTSAAGAAGSTSAGTVSAKDPSPPSSISAPHIPAASAQATLPASAMDLLAEDMHDIAETVHQLDARLADDAGYGSVKTPQRHVRTRLYFTSESHVHALVNTLKYWALKNGRPHRDGSLPQRRVTPGTEGSQGGPILESSGAEETSGTDKDGVSSGGARGAGTSSRTVQTALGRTDVQEIKRLVSAEGRALLDSTPELDYLTHIVFRQYENFSYPYGHPKRHRVEILFSAGSAYSPFTGLPRTPRVKGEGQGDTPVVEAEDNALTDLSLAAIGASTTPPLPPSLPVPPSPHPQPQAGSAQASPSLPARTAAAAPPPLHAPMLGESSLAPSGSTGSFRGGEETWSRSSGGARGVAAGGPLSASALVVDTEALRDEAGTPGGGSATGSTSRARFLSTDVKPPAAFTGPSHATPADLTEHTLPVAPLVPLTLSLSLDDFEDIMAEAIYSGANLGSPYIAGNGASGGPSVGLGGGGGHGGGSASALAYGSTAGSSNEAGKGAGGQGVGGISTAGAPPLGGLGLREQHPKEEAKARVAQAAARIRRNMGDGYFLY